MAGALGLKLAGPRVYGETLVDDVFMGSGRREADAADIRAGAPPLQASVCDPGRDVGSGCGVWGLRWA